MIERVNSLARAFIPLYMLFSIFFLLQDEPKLGKDSNKPNIQPLDIKTLNKTELANRNQAIRNQPMILDDDSDDEDDELDEKKITVPLTVTMVVIAGYIFGGAVLFGLWEGKILPVITTLG